MGHELVNYKSSNLLTAGSGTVERTALMHVAQDDTSAGRLCNGAAVITTADCSLHVQTRMIVCITLGLQQSKSTGCLSCTQASRPLVFMG